MPRQCRGSLREETNYQIVLISRPRDALWLHEWGTKGAQLGRYEDINRKNSCLDPYQPHLTKIAFGRPFLSGTVQIWPMERRNEVTSIATRAGYLIYWVACAAALLWAVFVLMASADLPHPDWTMSTPIAIVGAVVIWSAGRVARYALIRWEHFDQKGNSDAGPPTSKRPY